MRKKLFYIFLILCIILFGITMFELSKFPKDLKISDKNKEKSVIIIEEKEKLVLGYVKEMKTTCYSLVEFASKGITANGYEIQGRDGWYNKKGKMFVAHNGLSFGTKIKIEGFGETIFEVIDRIGWGTELDIFWGDGIDAYRDCLNNFGTKKLEVLVLQDKTRAFPN